MQVQRWLPLEANPDVMNQFLRQLGMRPSWQFVDVYGMDVELLSLVPRPVCAVLLLFPVTEKYELFRAEEAAKIKAQGQEVGTSVYFMKQTISNACGTIGLIHAVANNRDKLNFEPDSAMQRFLEDSWSMSPEERAKYLEKDESIRVTHECSAQEGQTERRESSYLSGGESRSSPFLLTPPSSRHAERHKNRRFQGMPAPEAVVRGVCLWSFADDTVWVVVAPSIDEKLDLHFIALVHHQGHLYELDGRKPFPVSHGRTSDETLLEDAIEVCKKFMQRDPNELRFTVVALSRT